MQLPFRTASHAGGETLFGGGRYRLAYNPDGIAIDVTLNLWLSPAGEAPEPAVLRLYNPPHRRSDQGASLAYENGETAEAALVTPIIAPSYGTEIEF